MEHKKTSMGEVMFLVLGEILVSLVTMGIFLLLKKFDWRVVSGVLIGSFVTILNFAWLSISVNRAVDRVMAVRGNEKMTDEQAEAFAAKHTAEIQKSVKASYLIRQIVVLGILVMAVILKVTNVLAAVIPLLLFRPILMVREAFRNKKV